MNFNLTEDRQMLADSLGRYLSDRYAFETRNRIAFSEQGWSNEHWAALAELGITGALFSEKAGGFGGVGFDIGAVFEQLGKALVVEPFLGALMAGRELEKFGGHGKLLADVIAGNKIAAFAHQEPESRYELANVRTRGGKTGTGWELTGLKAVVPQDRKSVV